eukprot:TRINITY_DN7294_c0_g1_i1.p2 TRINITY_DN7294_c0_g1~~TRINITY_DN7294_c0_g1_i1.p2  ORF type:complete len:331 (+),score=165.29 TRINITY_DN7294_c0_g1_i1:30-995(+)
MIGCLVDLLQTVLLYAFLFSLLGYLVPLALQNFVYKDANLKKRYPNAKWALVSGASTGIGKAVSEKLAEQGFNVVLVALPDKNFDATFEGISSAHPGQSFRRIDIDLSRPGAGIEVADQVADLPIDVVFSNAGYIVVGLFGDLSVETQMKNYHVNTTTAVELTQKLTSRMIERKAKGCIVFTSSPAGLIPCPTSAIYGATKAFLTNFASTLSVELRPEGIDVLAFHPSPVNTNFYSGSTAQKSNSLLFFKRTATTPQLIAEAMMSSVGRPLSDIRDQGYFSICSHLLLKVVDYNLLTSVMSYFFYLFPEYQTLQKERAKKQ